MLSLFLALGICVHGDTYMHNPRGSNNRLNEQSANRANANRCFDSQNNNRGGYNVGDSDADNGFNDAGDADNNIFNKMYNVDEEEDQVQYQMMYMEGSNMRMTWTSQHGCGNAKNNCNMLIQWGCDTDNYLEDDFNSLKNKGTGLRMQIRNGGNTNTPNDPNNRADIDNQFNNNNGNQANNGNTDCRHESEEYYYFAKKRTRNEGLFTADQNLKGNTQIYTRQNPNGNRRGLEVPEERDYFPWHRPSPFKDIAWIGNDVDYCEQNIKPESMNVKEKYTCVDNNGGQPDLDNLPQDDQIEANNAAECTAAGGIWHGIKYDLPDLDCQQAAWSQVNNLGNVDGTTLGGQTQSYMWTIPTLQQMEDAGCHIYTTGETVNNNTPFEIGTNDNIGSGRKFARIIVRNRYNISTMDYDPYNTFAESNQDLKEGVISPIQQNPTVDTGAHMQGLRLAINTAQTGRVFQDRSHALLIMSLETPNGNAPVAAAAKSRVPGALLNVNVRGKRGNIVQTYPAVEYDFEPNDITMDVDQCLHFQWTGSNTHNNGNPAGDGQAGDAGEGTGGTDRSNIAELPNSTAGLRSSYPRPYDVGPDDTFLDNADCRWALSETVVDPQDAKVILASGGYYSRESQAATNDHSIENRDELDPLLNNVSASFRQGLICCVNKPGEWFLVSTRNNNFSNRSQKLHIVAKAAGTSAQSWEFYKPVNSN